MHQTVNHPVTEPLRWPALLLLIVLALAGCRRGQDEAAGTAITAPGWHADAPALAQAGEQGSFVLRELVTGLAHPWALVFLPDGAILVSERPGRLRRIQTDGRISEPLTGVPAVFTEGQSGLLDITLSPQFADDGLVYLAYGEANWRGNKAGTAVARGRLTATGLDDVEVIFRQEPKLSSGSHIGARLLFDDAGYLFIGAGDNRNAPTAQLLDHLQGKLVRLQADGTVPADNPFVGRDDARPEIWSYGHRNSQGMALHPVTRQLWTHEHGPQGGDEINLPQAGKNYGWPTITWGIDYSGAPVPGAVGTSAPGLEQPAHYWPVSPAVSGMAFYTGDKFPQWQGNLFIGALATHELIRLQLDGERVVHDERLLTARNDRIRDVRQGPDGLLYLLTDAPAGKLLRLEPAPQPVSGGLPDENGPTPSSRSH